MRQVITELLPVSVDTHGYPDMGMACSKLARFDLCPRVHNMADRKLHVLRGMKIPESIADHVVQDVSLNSIREHWSALLTNIVMAFNAGQLQKSVDAEVAHETELSDCITALEHIGPVAYGHINFRGTYAFPIDRYAARILRAAA
jgi:TnpA family transposase